MCEVITDDHGKAMVASIIKNYGDEEAVTAEVCSVLTNHCAEGGGDNDGDYKLTAVRFYPIQAGDPTRFLAFPQISGSGVFQ